MSRIVAGALIATTAALGCARPGSPPGGPVDESPPRVVSVSPAAFDTLTDLRAPAVIRFDERISERLDGVAEFREAVVVSPADGEVLVDRGRRALEIRLAGGWQPDRVYRVVVLPVFRDLFGNQRVEPIELVFSTGAPIPETALAGFVRDRLTGQTAPGARVEAVAGDGAVYGAVSDTGGFFAMRFTPPGSYGIRTWLDQDRDLEPDFFEAQDREDATLGTGDTVVVELALLPMDTTPAQLARAEPVDSTRVRLTFDDHFAPGPVAGSARLYLLPDTVLVTEGGRLIHASTLDSILAAEEAARDSIEAEAAARDSLPSARDTVAPPPPDTAGRDTTTPAPSPGRQRDGVGGPTGRPGAAREPTGPLPARELILVLPEPLVPDTSYYVGVEGVVNIRGVPGGGGEAPFRSLPPDTAAAPADTTAAPADTAAAPTDTVAAPADTTDTAAPGEAR